MNIADVDISEAGIQGDFTAAQGVGFCGGGQVVEVKLRVKGQQAVRDTLVVHLFDLGPDHIKMIPDTVGAIADCVGNGPSACVTVIACSHVA